MAPLSGLHQSSLPSDFEAPFQPLARPGPSPYLAPARLPGLDRGPDSDANARRPRQRDSRSRSRRGKRTWKKLLWVKQSYPDNYTDQATFLENLQRNPRLQPYEFWPLVADSTVVVQHVSSVIIFVVCFVGIFQERVSPVSVVSWGSFATFAGWCLYDWWVGQEASEDSGRAVTPTVAAPSRVASSLARRRRGPEGGGFGVQSSGDIAKDTLPAARGASDVDAPPSAASSSSHLPLCTPLGERSKVATGTSELSGPNPLRSSGPAAAHNPCSAAAASSTAGNSHASGALGLEDPLAAPKHRPSSPLRGGRAHLRINAMKSALLIYFTLLGLSPILKSLTRSTSSDSIWAMSFWLLAINIFFFDYSGTWVGVNNVSVASLSTNAALMASTVLASRLPSTGQVFGLTLFSIEVFGLFPVFRRYARHRSWRFHILLTILLVTGAGGGVGMTLTRQGTDTTFPWRSCLLGMVLGCLIAAIAMGGCIWWLLGLQKYKNEIYGPWDPARPVIISRRHWDDE